MTEMTKAAKDVLAERQRQIEAEGWTSDHDDEHDDGSLLRAGVLYWHHATQWEGITYQADGTPTGWPWDAEWWKPKDKIRDLVRAGALCVAERERLQRAGRPHHHVEHKYDLIVKALEAALSQPAGGGK